MSHGSVKMDHESVNFDEKSIPWNTPRPLIFCRKIIFSFSCNTFSWNISSSSSSSLLIYRLVKLRIYCAFWADTRAHSTTWTLPDVWHLSLPNSCCSFVRLGVTRCNNGPTIDDPRFSTPVILDFWSVTLHVEAISANRISWHLLISLCHAGIWSTFIYCHIMPLKFRPTRSLLHYIPQLREL